MMTCRLLWLCLVVAIVSAMAKPSDGDDPFADDLTSDYAKKIIVQAKVAEIKTMMKPEVSPCDDFYTHACGNWHRHNPAQLFGNLMTDNLQLLSKGFDRRLQRLLRSDDLQAELEKKMQRFYMSCNLVHRDDVHYKLALENVIGEYGVLPALVGPQWNSSDFSWWRLVAQIQQKYGKQIILGLEIMHDIRNTSMNRVYISQPDFKTPNTRLTNLLEEVRISMDLQQYFGLSPSVAKHTAEQIHELETTFSTGGSGAATLQESLSLYTVADLQEKYSDHLNFTEFLALILGEENIPESLYIYDEKYLDNALLVMRSTPLATQANYVMWKLLEDFLVDAKPNDMVKWCTESTKKYFGKLAEHAVYKRYRRQDVESEVHKIWNQIKGIFRQRLLGDKLDWISNATRTLAIGKLERMQMNINSHDDEDFENLYGEVSIDRLNYVPNVQQLLIAKGKNTVARINQPANSVDATDLLGFTPAYNILENNISIPVALLQPRYFWGDQYPEALKYSTLGYLLAHEMLHGFDDDGRQYDASGNLAPWWDSKSRYEFEERRKCFQAQYHQYKYGGSKLPERKDQSENIADSGGVKLAYAAYEQWLGQQSEEVLQRETMEGLPFNSRQLFFLGYAQLMCDDVQFLFQPSVTRSDNHAPSKYRVIGPLSNFQEFPWVFNCSQSAPMDPEYKCAIY
ncbi:membrane metallo-endopeptidase-like 1 [Drosophila santomea]|uniref:membrane metallo-endopeptidase-like 1 n=1 Tax=Drosophila santomea TaxID=129105 RepID=UPI00195471C6|nr:membrane metallo-endopeptidase-like 1 [Drosophila santomea]